MNKLSVILTLFLFISSNSLLPNELSAQNLRNQEDKLAKDIFKNHYKIKSYPIFTGLITELGNNAFKFDDKTIVVLENISKELKYILEKGIFYPNIITGERTSKIKTKQELDSMSETQILFYNMARTDSVRISNFEELTFLNKSPKQRRFKFFLYSLGFSNPTVCFIELTNDNASKNETLIEFIDKCKVTFFVQGSIVI